MEFGPNARIKFVSRMQDEGNTHRTSWQCIKTMAREEGFRSFFRGSWLRVIRVAPGKWRCLRASRDSVYRFLLRNFYSALLGGAIQFAMYEKLSHWLENRH